MPKSNPLPERPSGLIYRLIQSLTFVLVLACLISGYLGLRAIVWRHEAELEAMLKSGLIIAGVVGLVIGISYLVFGARSLRLLTQFHWMNVQLGLVLGMLLYGVYNVFIPMPTYAQSDITLRALQGAVDGALIGTFVGGLVGIVGGRAVTLTPHGIVRYSALFFIVLLLIAISISIANQPGLPRNLAIWLLIPLLVVLKVALGMYDRRQHTRRSETYENPPAYNDE